MVSRHFWGFHKFPGHVPLGSQACLGQTFGVSWVATVSKEHLAISKLGEVYGMEHHLSLGVGMKFETVWGEPYETSCGLVGVLYL